MIFRPHFTYIAAVTPEQTQAKEAATNEEWRKKVIFHPVVHVHITPEPIVRPPIRIIRLVNPPMRQEQTESRELRTVRIQSNEPSLKRDQTQVRYRRPIPLLISTYDTGEPTFTVPRRIFIPSESTTETSKRVWSPQHASPVFWKPRNSNNDKEERKYVVYNMRPPQMVRIDRGLYQAEGTTPIQIYNNVTPPPQMVRIDRGLHQADGTTPPPPSEQQTNNISSSSRTNPIVGRTLSALEQSEGVSTSPPRQQQTPQANSTSSSSRQNPIVANAATPQQSGSSNPLGAIGSFFGGLANAVTSAGSTIVNDVTGAAKSVGNAISGALSAANNAIQNAYNSAFGNQTQQEKQQLQNQLNQLNQQGQQELNQISQEKQQVQSQLQQVQQQAEQELNQINQEKQQVQSQLQQVQSQAQQELTQINAEKLQVQSQLQQVQQQAQQELTQISQNEQQLQNELQQIQQYQAQAMQMLQQNTNNPQLQNYLQQLQQAQQQVEQGLIQLQQEQQQIQSQLQQAQLQGQQELMQLNQAQQQVLTQLEQAKQQGQQELMQLNQAQQQIQSQLQQAQLQGQQELMQLNQAQQQIQSQLQQAQQQIQQEMSQLNKQGQGGNPIQQFFNDVADVSALVGYYATEGLGGVGEELAHVVQGKGLENFGQAVSQFNAAGGRNIARAVGDVTEVALPAIVTAVVAPELLPAELIGEASSVGIGEVVSKVTTGKWQSLPQVLQEANEGGVLGAIGEAGGLALESGLAKGAGALTKLLTGSEETASKIAGLTPVWRAAGGALTNTALQLPFTQNPEQLAIAGIIGGLAGGLGPGVAGKLMSKIDEIRGTGGVAELETFKSPLTGETTEAWKITLPNGDTIHLVPKTTFGEGDIRDFVDAYTGKTTLATHVTPSRDFLNDVENGEVTVTVAGKPPGGAWAFREWGKFRNLYLSPGEGENEGVALAAYAGLTDTRPSIPDFRLGRSSVRDVLNRFIHPFDNGGIIGVKTDAVDIEPPKELRDYILTKKAEYLAKGANPSDLNNLVMKDLLNDPTYGPMYKEYINRLQTYSAENGEPVIDPEGLLGLTHERQIEVAPGAKLRGTGEAYNIWIRKTPELLENLPGPLRDILSDWSRFKYVGAEIVPGEPLNLFEDTESNETGEKGAREFSGEEGGKWNEGGERVEEKGEEKIQGEEGGEGRESILNESGGRRLPEPISRELLWTGREPQLEDTGSQAYTSPPRVSYPSRSPIDNPQILPPPTRSPPPVRLPLIRSPQISSPPPIRSPQINSPPPIHSPPPINSPPINSPPINLPPIYSQPIYSPPTSVPEYIEIESQSSSPPPVFSLSSIIEEGSSIPMGPPPMVPSVMPGGFGGGGNDVQEISGLAGEVIYL